MMFRQNGCFGASSSARSGEVNVALLIITLPSSSGWSAVQSRETRLPHPLDCLERQMQHLQDQVDGFNEDERDDDAPNAVDQQIAAQEWSRPDRAVLDSTQC